MGGGSVDPLNPTPLRSVMKPKYLRVLAVAGVLAIAGAACGSNDDDNSSATDDTTATTAGSAAAADGTGTEAGAAKLRSGLTALLQEHVYLAGIATGTALCRRRLRPRRPPPSTRTPSHCRRRSLGVRRCRRASSSSNCGASTSASSSTTRQARRPRTTPRSRRLVADLDGYRADFGAFLASANPNLTKDAVADEL